MATTDAGTNETYAKKAVQVLLRSLPTVIFLPHNCLEHAAHLGVLGALKLCDDWLKGHRTWKFFSSVAIAATTLRDLSQSLFQTWKGLFGDASAIKSVKSLFPRCIAGRWGSIHETEERMMKAGIGKLGQAFKHMCEAQPGLLDNDKRTAKSSLAEGPDTIALEEAKQFKIKMGRYRRQTWETLQDPLFQKLVPAMHATRGPWMHLSYFLKKKLPADAEGHLSWLTCGKAQELFEEFNAMLFQGSSAYWQ